MNGAHNRQVTVSVEEAIWQTAISWDDKIYKLSGFTDGLEPG
jgi:hypothetical protein